MAKKTRKKEYLPADFTDSVIDEFTDAWIEWLEEAYFEDKDGNLILKHESPRTSYLTFLIKYNKTSTKRVTLTLLETLFEHNVYFNEKMHEVDLMYMNLLDSYFSAGKVSSTAGKFLFTNKFKELGGWSDTKEIKSHSLVEKIVWNETAYVDVTPIPSGNDIYKLDTPKKTSSKALKSSAKKGRSSKPYDPSEDEDFFIDL